MSKKTNIDLQQVFAELANEKIASNLDKFLSRVFGLVLMFLDDEITPQQRQIWYVLCSNYPESHSGLEIADKIGASKISKGIYNSLRTLEELNLITVDSSHPKVFSVKANADHTMTRALIDLCQYYGR